MLDVAKGKRASLSSLFQSYDASIAVRENERSEFFHTGDEHKPWWQVDLGENCAITRVELYNREGFAERCTQLGILTSLDGERWRPTYWKRDDVQFGADEETKLVVQTESVARYLRVVKTKRGVFHLRRCKVFGALASLQESKAADQRERSELSTLEAGRQGSTILIDAFHVFLDERYTKNVNDVIKGGLYEARERHLASIFLQPGDRVLEVGTAIGVVAMNAAVIVGPENLRTFDASPTMTKHACLNFAYNRLPIQAVNGVLRNRSRCDDRISVEFFLSKEFWSSRLGARKEDADITDVVVVAFHTLEDELLEHRSNVLICDIEGGEYDLLVGADLSHLRLIIVEIHYWAVGEAKLNEMARYVTLQGFQIELAHTQESMIVFTRVV